MADDHLENNNLAVFAADLVFAGPCCYTSTLDASLLRPGSFRQWVQSGRREGFTFRPNDVVKSEFRIYLNLPYAIWQGVRSGFPLAEMRFKKGKLRKQGQSCNFGSDHARDFILVSVPRFLCMGNSLGSFSDTSDLLEWPNGHFWSFLANWASHNACQNKVKLPNL